MTVKDAFETEGVVTTSGAPELAAHVPDRDADAVARLKDAGAVIFGKTNLPLDAGDMQTFNEVYGRTNNPYAPDRTVGGSSGGSAAALAAGLTGFELGSDIGGSIRNPAHFCGVFGLKPTWGIIPGRGHIPGPPGTLSDADVGVFGPMGRSAGDLALGLDVLAGPASHDAVAWRLELPRPATAGAWPACGWRPGSRTSTCPSTATFGWRSTARPRRWPRPARPSPRSSRPPASRSWSTCGQRLVLPILFAGLDQDTFGRFATAVEGTPLTEDEDESVRRLRAITARHRDWLAANEHRQRLRARFAAFFAHHDVLLAPVMPTAAFPHDTERDMVARTIMVDGVERPYLDGLGWNSAIGGLLLPVAVPPVGRTPDGLPVGVQVIAPHLHDRTAVAVAGHLEDLLGGFVPPPGY